MSETTLDSRGRLTLPKELRERYGDEIDLEGKEPTDATPNEE